MTANILAKTTSFGRPSRPLKVLHVVRQFYPGLGGLEDFVANLGREQVRAGCDVRVLTCDRLFSQPDKRLAESAELNGISICRLPFFGSFRYPIVPGLLSKLGDADIVHVHAIDSFFDALALTKVVHRKPLIATTHGGFFHTKNYAQLKSVWFHGVTRLSSLAYGKIIGCSSSDSERFKEIAGSRVTTIENGVDLAKFRALASPTPLKSIVTIARFSKNKRLDNLIAAFSELVRRDPEWHLHIVGASSDWTPADIDAICRSAGVTEHVRIHAGLTDSEVGEIVRRASFFVSASEFEGFGIALIEAISAGLVPIVHPNASFKELAARHPVVRLADFNDPTAVANELEAAWQSRDRIVETDLSRYAWSTVVERYLSIYASLL